MARPRAEKEKKLSVRFIFRMTEDERSHLVKYSKICGKAPSTLAREKLFSGTFPEPKTPKIDLNTYLELKKIGVNLNQLTRLANAGKISASFLGVIMKLMKQQETIIAKLIYDSQSENR
jgi:hypothetical protein